MIDEDEKRPERWWRRLMAAIVPGQTGCSAQGDGAAVAIDEGYEAERVAQFAGYMLSLAGGAMDKTVMSKLIYMADRSYASARRMPFFGDRHRALPNGPICGRALDGLNGKADVAVFARYVERDGDLLTLAAGAAEAGLGQMNETMFEIAEDLHRRYGHMSRQEIVAHCHGPEFPEWSSAFAKVTAGEKAGDIDDEAFARAAKVDPSAYAAIAKAVRGAPRRGAGR